MVCWPGPHATTTGAAADASLPNAQSRMVAVGNIHWNPIALASQSLVYAANEGPRAFRMLCLHERLVRDSGVFLLRGHEVVSWTDASVAVRLTYRAAGPLRQFDREGRTYANGNHSSRAQRDDRRAGTGANLDAAAESDPTAGDDRSGRCPAVSGHRGRPLHARDQLPLSQWRDADRFSRHAAVASRKGARQGGNEAWLQRDRRALRGSRACHEVRCGIPHVCDVGSHT